MQHQLNMDKGSGANSVNRGSIKTRLLNDRSAPEALDILGIRAQSPNPMDVLHSKDHMSVNLEMKDQLADSYFYFECKVGQGNFLDYMRAGLVPLKPIDAPGRS